MDIGLRRRAFEVLRTHLLLKPGSLTMLWPYELLEGCPRANVLGRPHLEVGRQWHMELHSEVLRSSFRVPRVGARFAHAISILDEAVAVETRGGHHTDRRLWSSLNDLIQPRGWFSEGFEFYVAGGFVVGTILGHGGWRDVDVWFTPGLGDGEVRFVCGRGPYRVNVHAVTDPVSTIECLDLHICQCAIQCSVRGGVRFYRLLMTPACAHAWMQTRVSLTPWHTAIAYNWRKGAMFSKYSSRRLDLSLGQRCGAERARENFHGYMITGSVGDGVSSAPILPGDSKALWLIFVRGNLFCGVSLRFVAEEELRRYLPFGVLTTPALIYPCDDLGGSPGRYFATAGVGDGWCVRALAGATFIIAVPGVGRVLSNFVQPSWLVSRADLDMAVLVEDIRSSLPRLPDGLRSALGCDVADMSEIYVLEFGASVRPLVMFRDWWRPSASEGVGGCGLEISVLLELQSSAPLPARMFCVETKELCGACNHGGRVRRCRPLVIVDVTADPL